MCSLTADAVAGTTCLQISTTDILDEIRSKQLSGCDLQMDGVGEMAVPDGGDASCTDTGGNVLCGLVGSGILHCNDDFCPDCQHAHACDLTCGFCDQAPATGDGKPHNGGKRGGGAGRRREQITIDAGVCSPPDFLSRTDSVNSACCDEGGDECADGIPNQCDARCALTYLEYYTECNQMLFSTVSAEQMTQLHRLDDVCMQLPPSDLLLALGQASCQR